MCGIAGIISKQTSKPEQRIKLCTDALNHRGPEDEDFYFNEARTVAFGHRRLSIIDIIHNSELHKTIQPHDAHAAENNDWKYWSASFLYRA